MITDTGSSLNKPQAWTGWVPLIEEHRWQSYQRVLKEMTLGGIPFALGGGIATAIHTGLWHDTQDLDFYILPADREQVSRLTNQLGFADVNAKLPYDHSWTYRATDGHVIVEAIWSMRNGRASVDSEWLDRSGDVEIGNLRVKVGPVEELIWHKLYVVMKERCDWPDIMNYFYSNAASLDWKHLLKRLEGDAPLLASALALFSWISPDRTRTVPEWVWEHLGLRVAESVPFDDGLCRATFLNTNNWYAPMAKYSRSDASE